MSTLKTGGVIASYQLTDWWDNELIEDERKTILSVFGQGYMGPSLTEGSVQTTGNAFRFLSNIGQSLTAKKYSELGNKVFIKGDKLLRNVVQENHIEDIHFYLQLKSMFYYRCRDEITNGLKIAIDSMNQQIKISPNVIEFFKNQDSFSGKLPAHVGFKQLAILYEKDKQFKVAIKICRRAKSEGWSGDWNKRIERCSKNLSG